VPIWQPVTHLIYTEQQLTLSIPPTIHCGPPTTLCTHCPHPPHDISLHYDTQSLLRIITKENYVQPFLSDGHLCFFWVPSCHQGVYGTMPQYSELPHPSRGGKPRLLKQFYGFKMHPNAAIFW